MDADGDDWGGGMDDGEQGGSQLFGMMARPHPKFNPKLGRWPLHPADRLLEGVTEGFFVECAIGCLDFENTLATEGDFIDRQGYRALDFKDLVYSPTLGTLWLAEVAFVRKVSPVCERLPRGLSLLALRSE